MRSIDLLRLAANAVTFHRGRSILTALGIAVGIAAVVLLTSIGSGVQRFVLAEFTQFGTNLLAITPGKTTTFGLSGAVISTVRPLSLEDAAALRDLPRVLDVVPFVQGNAAVEGNGRSRRTMIFGVGAGVPDVWQIAVALGRFLPDDEPRRARAYAVLGSKLKLELFGDHSPLGARIRVGGESYRIIGVMEAKGQMLGFDLDDSLYLPVGRALAMFDRESLMEIDILYSADADPERLRQRISERLIDRHGSEDFTIITQDEMLEVMGTVLDTLTFAIGALGGISLLVGGVGILTIMTISINERLPEIGLLRALGAPRRQVLGLFLTEAAVIGGAGGICGLILGAGSAWLLGQAIPALPTHTSWDYALLALAIAIVTGLVAGALPAWRAARMDPVQALRNE